MITLPKAWFTTAAIESIAACVSGDIPIGERTAKMIVLRYFESNRDEYGFGLAQHDFFGSFFRNDYAAHLRFYAFAGLVELAVSVGYVDLEDWVELANFLEALKDFEKREASSNLYSTDLSLIQELLSRVKEKRYRATAIDNNSFYAFASYLQLTNAVHMDARCHSFLWDITRWRKSSNSDLSFLLSPRHFAEALGTGSIAGIPASELSNGLVTLNYFRWFTEILTRASQDSEISDKFIRHARWSHHAVRVRERVDVWAARISEWDELAGEREDESTHAEQRRSALLPSESDLNRLKLLDRPIIPMVYSAGREDQQASAERLLEDIDLLLTEGRKGAAKKRLRLEISRLDYILQQHVEKAYHWRRRTYADQDWKSDWSTPWASAFWIVTFCKKLAELGDVDAAAVFLAKYADYLVANLGPDYAVTKDALALIALSRTEAHSRPGSIVAQSSGALLNMREDSIAESATTEEPTIGEQDYLPERDAEP
jgi:hypothetical protein